MEISDDSVRMDSSLRHLGVICPEIITDFYLWLLTHHGLRTLSQKHAASQISHFHTETENFECASAYLRHWSHVDTLPMVCRAAELNVHLSRHVTMRWTSGDVNYFHRPVCYTWLYQFLHVFWENKQTRLKHRVRHSLCIHSTPKQIQPEEAAEVVTKTSNKWWAITEGFKINQKKQMKIFHSGHQTPETPINHQLSGSISLDSIVKAHAVEALLRLCVNKQEQNDVCVWCL